MSGAKYRNRVDLDLTKSFLNIFFEQEIPIPTNTKYLYVFITKLASIGLYAAENESFNIHPPLPPPPPGVINTALNTPAAPTPATCAGPKE